MPQSKQALSIHWLIGVALAVAGGFFVFTGAGPAQAQEGNTLEAAIEAYVESQGETYAGPCTGVDIEEDLGQWCSEIRSQSATSAEVALGPTFSEFVETVTFEQVDGTWYAGGPDFSPPHSISATTFDAFVNVSWARGENNQFFCVDTAFSRSDLLNISGSWSNWGCGTTQTSLDLTNLACDRIHYYRVWAAGPNTSGYSDYGTFRSQDCDFSPPVNPASELLSATSVLLTWEEGLNNLWSCVDLARTQGDLLNLTGSWFNTGCGTTTPSVEVTGLACDTTYYWRAWAAGPDASGYTSLTSFETPACEFSTQPVTISNGGGSGLATLTDVRIGAHADQGFDRIVFEFEDGLPSETTVQYEQSAVQCGSGFPEQVNGTGILTVRMSFARAHNEAGDVTVDATQLSGTSGSILEAVQTCDFEGIVEWAVGTDEVAGFRVTSLTNPDRIVVDVRR